MSSLRPPTRERDARRRRRELDRQQIQFESAPEHKRAIYEVERYENYLAVLCSVHQEGGSAIDWNAVARAPEPSAPERSSMHEDEARRALEGYAPGWLDRLLGRSERRVSTLRGEVASGARTDAWAYEQAVERYHDELERWRRQLRMAERVLRGDETAYREALEVVDPFAEIRDLGSRVEVGDAIAVHVDANASAVVPVETKSLSASGRLTSRPVSPEHKEKILLDYASSCVLRIATELFAILPVDVADIGVWDASDSPMMKLRIPRAELEELDLAQVEPARHLAASGW